MTDRSISQQNFALIGLAFLCSGAAGLIYQVAWQRLLFANFGVDLISVCIIVSTFMLGLGLGALAGGWLGDRFPAATLKFFVLCEVVIGLFGLVSPFLIRALGLWLSDASFAVSGLANFLLMLIPTFFMGATLPVLIAHLVRVWRNVGAATGHLYALNTLGAMLGCSLTAFWLFHWMELDRVIQLAAAINFGVAAAVGLSLQGAEK
ncbi:fused MFS/spermidine synthase [Dechloromonas sp. ZY10]|uniref:fused MFS/spermidine synthase n=1 Tax=Dechloromonas aquae TaxID=2664436 RepID=UPI0035277A4E